MYFIQKYTLLTRLFKQISLSKVATCKPVIKSGKESNLGLEIVTQLRFQEIKLATKAQFDAVRKDPKKAAATGLWDVQRAFNGGGPQADLFLMDKLLFLINEKRSEENLVSLGYLQPKGLQIGEIEIPVQTLLTAFPGSFSIARAENSYQFGSVYGGQRLMPKPGIDISSGSIKLKDLMIVPAHTSEAGDKKYGVPSKEQARQISVADTITGIIKTQKDTARKIGEVLQGAEQNFILAKENLGPMGLILMPFVTDDTVLNPFTVASPFHYYHGLNGAADLVETYSTETDVYIAINQRPLREGIPYNESHGFSPEELRHLSSKLGGAETARGFLDEVVDASQTASLLNWVKADAPTNRDMLSEFCRILYEIKSENVEIIEGQNGAELKLKDSYQGTFRNMAAAILKAASPVVTAFFTELTPEKLDTLYAEIKSLRPLYCTAAGGMNEIVAINKVLASAMKEQFEEGHKSVILGDTLANVEHDFVAAHGEEKFTWPSKALTAYEYGENQKVVEKQVEKLFGAVIAVATRKGSDIQQVSTDEAVNDALKGEISNGNTLERYLNELNPSLAEGGSSPAQVILEQAFAMAKNAQQISKTVAMDRGSLISANFVHGFMTKYDATTSFTEALKSATKSPMLGGVSPDPTPDRIVTLADGRKFLRVAKGEQLNLEAGSFFSSHRGVFEAVMGNLQK